MLLTQDWETTQKQKKTFSRIKALGVFVCMIMCMWEWVCVSIKALQKAEYSDFCIFTKFGTHFFPYSVFSVLRQNCILRNIKHMTKLTKQTKYGVLGPINGVPKFRFRLLLVTPSLTFSPFNSMIQWEDPEPKNRSSNVLVGSSG